MRIDLAQEQTGAFEQGPAHVRLGRLVGRWTGTAKTWFDPTATPQQAPFEGEIRSLIGGRFVRFTYR